VSFFEKGTFKFSGKGDYLTIKPVSHHTFFDGEFGILLESNAQFPSATAA